MFCRPLGDFANVSPCTFRAMVLRLREPEEVMTRLKKNECGVLSPNSTDYGCGRNRRIPLAGSEFAMAVETVFKAVNLFHRIGSSSVPGCKSGGETETCGGNF